MTCPAPLTLLETVTLDGSPALPHFIRIYNSEGQLASEWSGDRGPIGWTDDPETLIFVGVTSNGHQLIAGDPTENATYVLASRPSVEIHVVDLANALIMQDGDHTRHVPLPGRLYEAEYPESFEYSVGPLRIENGEVWRGDIRLLADRGLGQHLLASPSGQWIAAIESQRFDSRIEYHLRIIDDMPQVLVVAESEPLRETPPASSLSPSETRVARVDPLQVSLGYRGDSSVLWYRPIGGDPDVWWSPNGDYFAFFSWDSRLMVSDLDGQIRAAIHGVRPHQFRGWSDDALVWRIWLVGGHP